MRGLLLAAGLLSTTLASAAQATQVRPSSILQAVEDRRIEYDAAKEKYQADSAAVESIRHRWDQLVDQLGAAHGRGEDDEVRRLSGLLEQRTEEKDRLEFQRDVSRTDWIAKGESLIDSLNDYLKLLDLRIQSPPVGSDDEANNLYNEYEARLRRIESELPREAPVFEPMPEVKFHPEDSPRERGHKLSLIQRRIDRFTELLAGVDRDIDTLLERQERNRRMRDREARRNRFGDDDDPTGGNLNIVRGDVGVTDSTTVRLSLEPLEDRIATLRTYREKMAAYLAELEKKFVENSPRGSER